jgi:hypothetical protein
MPQGLGVLAATFLLLFIAELGDKTQLAVINMTATCTAPACVFLGATFALSTATALGVLGGQALTRAIPPQVLHKIAAELFVIMGILRWLDKLSSPGDAYRRHRAARLHQTCINQSAPRSANNPTTWLVRRPPSVSPLCARKGSIRTQAAPQNATNKRKSNPCAGIARPALQINSVATAQNPRS